MDISIIIVAVIILIPFYVTILSASAYIGKVYALRFLFKNQKGGISNGEE